LAVVLGVSVLAFALLLSGVFATMGADLAPRLPPGGAPGGANPAIGMVATATAQPASGAAPLHVAFQGSETRGTAPFTYSWSFGDNSSSTDSSPSHTYRSAGNYTATLKVTDRAKVTAADSVRIVVSAAVAALGVAPTASSTAGTVPLSVNFSAGAHGGTSPYAYNWNFGGRSNSSVAAPSHTFLYSGTYSVSVIVTDAAGATAKGWIQLNVTPTGPAPLSATASASTTAGVAPLAVNLTGGATGGKAPYGFSWKFGDGNSSVLQNPGHVYGHAGTYVAGITVTDAAGSTSAASVTVTVSGSGAGGVASTLVTGGLVAHTPGTFWSVEAWTSCSRCISTSSAVKSYLASTPFTWVRYGVDTESCNMSADVFYSPGGVASKGCGFNITALKSWCNSLTPHCHAILTLPGENNNSREDAAMAKWIVQTVGFQPDYWSIGNEPTGWTHYGIPWTSWKATDASRSNPLAYAYDVKAAIAAVSAVDPGAKFIGLEAACSCNTVWFQDIAKVDGASISAVGVHNYPSSGTTNVSLAGFYAPLAGSSNVTSSVASVRAALTGSCTSCATMPILVNEYNAGPGWAPSNHVGTYANAVFLAASVAQALTSNISQLTVFNLEASSSPGYGWSLLGSSGTVGPTGALFSDLLSHLARGSVYATHVATTVPNVWAVTTTNATTESILVVNANLTHAIWLSLGLGLNTSVTANVIHWGPTLPLPAGASVTLASSYSIPAQGILLVNVPLSVLAGVPTFGLASGGPSPSSAVPAAGIGVALLGFAVVAVAARRAERFPARPRVPVE
jgi:PKD repeat protein